MKRLLDGLLDDSERLRKSARIDAGSAATAAPAAPPRYAGFDWAAWASRSVSKTMARRVQKRRDSVMRFGLSSTYAYRPEVIEAQTPGRARLIRWELCRHALLTAIANSKNRIVLDPDQILLLEAVRDVQLAKIYGDFGRAAADLKWLKATYGVTELFSAVALIQPRRQGKTMVNAIASAITLLSQDGAQIYTYALATQTAVEWTKYLYDFMNLMKDHPLFGWREHKYAYQKQLEIISNATGRHAGSMAYGNCSRPQFAEYLRGTGNLAWMANLDEGLFFCDEANEVIYPTMRNGCAIALMSSKMKKENLGSELLHARYPDSGRPIWKILDWRNQCESCAALERQTNSNVICQHKAPKPPSTFLTYSDVARLEGLMKTTNAYDRELLNIADGGAIVPSLDADAIDRVLGMSVAEEESARLGRTIVVPVKSPVSLARVHSHFFVGMDPGASASDTAIISACFVGPSGLPDDYSAGRTPMAGHMLILAVEKFRYELAGHMADAIQRQIEAVRSLRFMQTAHAFIIVEVNLNGIGYPLKDEFNRRVAIPNCTYLHMVPIAGAGVYHRAAGGPDMLATTVSMAPGIKSTNESKVSSAYDIALMLREERLHWNNDGVVTYATTRPEFETVVEEEGIDELAEAGALQGPALLARMIRERADRENRGDFIRQLKNLRTRTYSRVNKYGDETRLVRIDGKSGYDRETQRKNNDDMALALMILIHGAAVFYMQPEYAILRRSHNILI